MTRAQERKNTFPFFSFLQGEGGRGSLLYSVFFAANTVQLKICKAKLVLLIIRGSICYKKRRIFSIFLSCSTFNVELLAWQFVFSSSTLRLLSSKKTVSPYQSAGKMCRRFEPNGCIYYPDALIELLHPH